MTTDAVSVTYPKSTTEGDFADFKITEARRNQLYAVGDFACDKIKYGYPPTSACGHLDGYRWLFCLQKAASQTWFVIFAGGDAESVKWDNIKALAYEASWDHFQTIRLLPSHAMMSHDEVLTHILRSVELFRKIRPFGAK